MIPLTLMWSIIFILPTLMWGIILIPSTIMWISILITLTWIKKYHSAIYKNNSISLFIILGCLFRKYWFSLDFCAFLRRLYLNSAVGSCANVYAKWSWLLSFDCANFNQLGEADCGIDADLLFDAPIWKWGVSVASLWASLNSSRAAMLTYELEPLEKIWPPHPSRFGLNSITTVLQQE